MSNMHEALFLYQCESATHSPTTYNMNAVLMIHPPYTVHVNQSSLCIISDRHPLLCFSVVDIVIHLSCR